MKAESIMTVIMHGDMRKAARENGEIKGQSNKIS